MLTPARRQRLQTLAPLVQGLALRRTPASASLLPLCACQPCRLTLHDATRSPLGNWDNTFTVWTMMAGKVSPPLLKVWVPPHSVAPIMPLRGRPRPTRRHNFTIRARRYRRQLRPRCLHHRCADTVLRTTVSGDGNGSTVVHLPSVVSALVLDSTDPSFRFAQCDSVDKV